MSKSAMDVRFNELKDMITQLNTTIETLNQTIAAQSKLLADKENFIAELRAELELMRRRLYGSSKEKTPAIDDAQFNFLHLIDNNEPEKTPEVVEPEYIEATSGKTRSSKRMLKEQFKNIEKKLIVVDTLSDEEKTCPVCGTEMVPIGTEVIRREIVHIQPRMYMVEYLATTYSCPECKDTEDPQFIKDDNAPEALIRGSYVSPSLAAWTFYQKFALSVPYNRLEKSFGELGGKIQRTTMANWAIHCNQMYFSTMTHFFHQKLLERKFIMMDETPIQVLNEPGRRAESKSYVWLMRSGEDGLPPIVFYHYSPSRSGDVAMELVNGIAPGTYLMCDGYSGYNKLKDIHRCTCYAHIRRYLFEAIPKGHGNDLSNPAVQGVMYCNKLFDFERKYAAKGLSYEQRRKRRLKEAKPVIEAFLAWADSQPASGNSRLAKAITYIRNRRDSMFTYLEDGRCSLSNNPSENSIRPITVGRKNWLFTTSVDGAEASMGIYTIVQMAELYGLSRYKYLEYLLTERPSQSMSDDELEQLAPWNEKVQRICMKCEKA